MFNYKYDELFEPTIKALKQLGGSASNKEIEEKVAEILNLNEEQVNDIHNGNRTKFSYRLAWSRTYLKNFGAIINSKRGIWALTGKGRSLEIIDKNGINSFVKNLDFGSSNADKEFVEEEEWKTDLLEKIKKISPKAFEELCALILRESGFEKVKVTQYSKDGGIDGVGIYRTGELLTIPVVFQCKKYEGSVSSPEIQKFRGAMNKRARQGLFITTGNFTRNAQEEAADSIDQRIDLIDGIQLVERMKKLEIGVKIEEDVKIDNEFFSKF